jgi:hypothetical protein
MRIKIEDPRKVVLILGFILELMGIGRLRVGLGS